MRRSPLVIATALALAACAPSEPTPNPHSDATACSAYADPELVSNLQDDALREASGICASRRHDDVFYLHDDSGGEPRVHATRLDGTPLGQFTIDGIDNIDWEDVACAPCAIDSEDDCLYVADVGDNKAKREAVFVHVVPEPDDPTAVATLPVLRTLTVTYDGGPRDVESVLVHPVSLDVYFVSKDPEKKTNDHLVLRTSGTASGDVVAKVVASVSPAGSGKGEFTGGDVHPDGTRIVLRTYGKVQEHRLSEDGAPFETVFGAEPIELPPIMDDDTVWQREAVTYSADGLSVITTSEGRNPPLHRWACDD